MSKPPSSELAPCFPPGFQRDVEALFLLWNGSEGELISTDEVRENLRQMGVILDEEPAFDEPGTHREFAMPPPMVVRLVPRGEPVDPDDDDMEDDE